MADSPLLTMTLPGGAVFETPCVENTRIIHDEIFVGKVYEDCGIDYSDGDTILDVGANLGLFVLWLNTRLTRGTIHAFEPVPAIFAGLERNVSRHNRLKVHLHNVGASARDEEVDFTFYPLTSSSSSRYPLDSVEAHADSRRFILRKLADGGGWRSLAVRLLPRPARQAWAESIRRHYQRPEKVSCHLIRLSDVIDAHRLTRIDLLKVDVEGAEFECLEGIEARHWPLVRQVVIEVHDGEDACARMEQILGGHGFATERRHPSPDIFHRHYLVYARRPQNAAARAGRE